MATNPVTHDMRTAAGKVWRDSVLIPAILLMALGRTLRNLQYALVGRAIFKTKGDFAQVMRVVRGMRLTGALGWDVLDERHRVIYQRTGWPDVGVFLAELSTTYQRDIQQGQPKEVIVLYEADGMTGIVSDVCGEYGVSYAALKGNASDGLLWKVARSVVEDRPLVVIVITDHDSSGQAIFTDVQHSVPWFYATPAGSSVAAFIEATTGVRFDPYSPMPPFSHPAVEVIHLGVHPAMLASLAAQGIDVPSDPDGDKGDKVFTSGGYEPTQAEAVNPDIWKETLSEVIEQHTDMDTLNEQKRAEAQERGRLALISMQEAQ